MNITKEEAHEIADFAKELIDNLQLKIDYIQYWRDKRTKRKGKTVFKNLQANLKDWPLAGLSVRDGLLGYLGFPSED